MAALYVISAINVSWLISHIAGVGQRLFRQKCWPAAESVAQRGGYQLCGVYG